MRRTAWIIFILVAAPALVDFALVFYAELGSCPAPAFDMSVRGSGFAMDLGPPFFTSEQLVLPPGSSAILTVTWTSDRMNLASEASTLVAPDRFLDVWTERMVTLPDAGVTISPLDISSADSHHLSAVLKLTASTSARGGTYSVFNTCRYDGPFLTVGVLPYVGPVLRLAQPVTFLLPFVNSGAIGAVVWIFLHFERRARGDKPDHRLWGGANLPRSPRSTSNSSGSIIKLSTIGQR